MGTVATGNNLPPYARFTFDSLMTCALIFHFFTFVWILFFLDHASKFVVSSAVAKWYFRWGPCPVWASYGKLLRYHVGSVALGSVLCSFLWPV